MYTYFISAQTAFHTHVCRALQLEKHAVYTAQITLYILFKTYCIYCTKHTVYTFRHTILRMHSRY